MDEGLDLERVLTTNDLAQGDNVFFTATGITDGEFLQGGKYFDSGAKTYPIVMRSKPGTVRRVEATHKWEKLMRFSLIKFD